MKPVSYTHLRKIEAATPLVKTTMSFPSAYYLCSGKMMIASIKSNYGKWETSKPVMIRKKSNKFFDIKPIIHKLSEYLFDDCFNIHYAIVDALMENGVTEVNSYIDKKSIRQSNALFNNYKDGFINKLDGWKVIQKIIMSNPYRREVYEFLIKEDGDFSREIENLAYYLGFDMKEYKGSLMDIYIKELMDKGVSDIEIAKEKVRKYAKYIGCTNENIFTTRSSLSLPVYLFPIFHNCFLSKQSSFFLCKDSMPTGTTWLS